MNLLKDGADVLGLMKTYNKIMGEDSSQKTKFVGFIRYLNYTPFRCRSGCEIYWGTDHTEVDFRGALLAGWDFRGMDLSGFDFQMSVLYKADFQDAICPRANFHKAYLGGANFQKANLRNADMSSCLCN